MSGVVVDTSVWINFLAGHPVPGLEEALARGVVVLAPVVVAELISGARRPRDRAAIGDLLAELEIHQTPIDHWIRVGELRRRLGDQGIAVSTPDAHVAQCAIDRDAILLSADAIFSRVRRHSKLKLGELQARRVETSTPRRISRAAGSRRSTAPPRARPRRAAAAAVPRR